MKRYAIWNKKDPILTPIGEVLTANQWIQRYPMAGLDTITVVCAAGEINGAFFGTLGQMIQMYENQGCDFSAYTTPEEILKTLVRQKLVRPQRRQNLQKKDKQLLLKPLPLEQLPKTQLQ